MVRHLLSFARAGRILLALALCAHFVSTAVAYTNGQAASLVLGQADFTSVVAATTASGMNNPFGVAVDPISGKIFVADTSNHRVLRFDDAASKANGALADGVLGQPDFASNNQDSTASTMRFPHGVAVDSAGRLWVADQENQRVLRFDEALIPTISWATPAAITYGTPLSAAQLNASTSVPGSFSYTPPAGSVLSAGSGLTLSVRFTPTDTDSYATITTTVTIDVNRATQTITFGALVNK